jgi:hypothetical protein
MIINIQNPTPILKQDKSAITTNPFIPNEQKIQELEILDRDANKIIEESYQKNAFGNLSLTSINQNMSKSIIGFLDDLFVKPKEEKWIDYLPKILQKDKRYTYFGILFIIISFYMMIVRS